MRILLADDQDKVRFGLRILLERQPNCQVVGEASTAEELLVQLGALRPDVVLLDWELPGRLGTDLVSAVKACCPDVAVIALSGRLEARRQALAAGVDAFVSKGDPPERLLAAIQGFLGAPSPA